MQIRAAVLRLLVAISAMAGSTALAHIDFKSDFECKTSYDSDCTLFSAEIDRRTLRIFFDASVAENGARCEIRTQKLLSELNAAASAIDAGPNSIEITSVRITSRLGARGIPNEFRCSYEVVSKRKDLRFRMHHLNRRFWTDSDDQNGVCMDDVRTAQAIPGSIGAAKWITAALLQGQMCETNYVTLGLDKVETDADGVGTIVKYGIPKPAPVPTQSQRER